MRHLLALLIAMFVAAPAVAQEAVVSPGPAAVSVTVYRAPGRGPDDEIDRAFPDGYALVTETRTVRIPAGRSVIRFQGVASGIFAESALIAGLPEGVREKNLDADLLSPRTLFDRALGRRVMLRRTNPATGAVSEEQGVIRSSRGGGMVLTTAAGVEAVHCSGLPEAVIHDALPDGLTARPTLSVELDSPVARDVTLTLSYLAGGFDWQANYVATMRSDGRSADLIAWLTLVSADQTSFVDAGTQVVAGKPNRDSVPQWSGQFRGGEKDYRCWQVGAGSVMMRSVDVPPPPPPPPMAAAPVSLVERQEIVVTGSRIARQEELGDLKLYRVPQPVTVAARGQKQVALLDKPAVPVRVLYVGDIEERDASDPRLTLRARNRLADGLGVPLPAGPVAVFQPVGGGRDVLVGETGTDDKAVDEEVEFRLDDTPGVAAEVEPAAGRKGWQQLVVSNANRWPITYEGRFAPGARVAAQGARLVERDGRRTWTTTVPANGTATLRYRVSD